MNIYHESLLGRLLVCASQWEPHRQLRYLNGDCIMIMVDLGIIISM